MAVALTVSFNNSEVKTKASNRTQWIWLPDYNVYEWREYPIKEWKESFHSSQYDTSIYESNDKWSVSNDGLW